MNTTIMLSRVTPKRVHMIRRYNSTLPKSQEPSISASPSPSSPSSSPHPGHPSSSSTSTSDPSDQPSSSSSSGISLSTQTLPSPPLGPISTSSSIPMWNPFHTHNFFRALEKSFPESVARTLMRATRGLLVGKIAGTKKDVLVAKDLENEAYLFRAALSEVRTELTMHTRKESAALHTAIAAVRRDVDTLDAKMKEDVNALKHELQIDTNNRQHEAKADVKKTDISIEELAHKATVTLSDLRTHVEQAKWDNTRRGVGVIAVLVIFVIASMEMAPKRPPPPPPPPTPPPPPLVSSATQMEKALDIRAWETKEDSTKPP